MSNLATLAAKPVLEGIECLIEVNAGHRGLVIQNNRISENLQCKQNNPPPTGGGNVAGDKEDQCARLWLASA